MARIVVFDCDGTLVDTAAIILAAMTRAFTSQELPAPPDEAVRRVVGLALDKAVVKLAPAAPPLLVRAVVQSYRDAYLALRATDSEQEPLFPGMADLLDELERAGHRLAIATGKSRRGVDHLIATHGLQQRFVSVQTADTNPSKPHPAMLLRAVAEAGGEPAEAVMIGDTSYDMEMARAAHVAAVGVAWGHHPSAHLLATGASEVAQDSAALRALLLP